MPSLSIKKKIQIGSFYMPRSFFFFRKVEFRVYNITGTGPLKRNLFEWSNIAIIYLKYINAQLYCTSLATVHGFYSILLKIFWIHMGYNFKCLLYEL